MKRSNTASTLLVRMARDTGQPVITEFGLYLLARKLFRDRGYEGQKIAHRNRELTIRRARTLISEATYTPYSPHLGYEHEPRADRLVRDPDFRSPLYVIAPGTAEQVMMAADPFCYLSHASALACHGLADPSPALHLTTPAGADWRAHAVAHMSAAFDNAEAFAEQSAADEEGLPFQLYNPQPLDMVRGTQVSRHETAYPTTPVTLEGRALRVSQIGTTFRDTLDTPAWCGGIVAVIAVWRRHARDHLEAIIPAIDAAREKIIRVRAGYLLEEVLGIDDPRIAAWVGDAQRGSSRKLDATAPYASRFSARWMLSINIHDPTLPSMTKAVASA